MTPTAAIRHAKTVIGQLYRCTTDGWGYNTWSESHRAWWLPTNGHAYADAYGYRRAAIVEVAVREMLRADGADEHDANVYVDPDNGWRYRRIIDWVRDVYSSERASTCGTANP